MNPPASPVFATTRWTQVLAARGDSDSARTALSELCAAYYGPVLAFLRHTGTGTEEAEDVAHEFFASLLTRNGVAGADRSRGKFRSYLLGALKHFVANRQRQSSRVKRGGEVEHVPLISNAETGLEVPVAAPGPELEALFDHEWALAVVEGALAQLEQEARSAGTGEQFAVLKAWLAFDSEPGSQAEAATRLGLNEGAVKVAVHRLRRRFRELVRAEVSQTLPAGVSAEEELQHLIRALGEGPVGGR